MSKLIFDDENIIFVNDHLSHFINKCKSFGISNDNELCRLFTFTFPKKMKDGLTLYQQNLFIIETTLWRFFFLLVKIIIMMSFS